MKKVKLMLISINLVAITGGVLAFKARTPDDYCTVSARTYTTMAGGITFWTCQDVANVILNCALTSVNTAYTSTTASQNFVCTVTADDDAQPCRDGNQPTSPPKKCPNKAQFFIEPPF